MSLANKGLNRDCVTLRLGYGLLPDSRWNRVIRKQKSCRASVYRFHGWTKDVFWRAAAIRWIAT